MAVFNIHPKGGLSSITCSLVEASIDPSVAITDYVVNASTLDLNESKREKIVYIPETGRARGIDVGTAPIKFAMRIFGNTQAGCLQSARNVTRAFRNHLGGYIEYRPYGLDSAMTTWYHYLASPSPKVPKNAVALSTVQMEGYGIANQGQKYAVEMNFTITIKPWATSDPTSLLTIVTGGNIYNCDDATYDNYIDVDSSDIKGDVLFPVIGAGDIGGIGKTEDIFVCRHRMRSGNKSNAFFIEAEDCTLSGFTSQVDATASGGDVARCTGASGYLRRACSALTGLDSTYVGAFVPLIAYKISADGTTHDITFSILDGVVNEKIWTSQAVELSYQSGEWRLLTTMEEVRFPTLQPAAYLDDSSSPTIGAWMGGAAQFQVDVTRTAGAGNIEIDFFFLAKADQGIGLFSIATETSYIDGASYVMLDTITNSFRLEHTSGYWMDAMVKEGSEITDFIMEKGYDHRLYFFTECGGSTFGGFEANQIAYSPDIFGIHGTIYPFDES